MLVIRKEQMTAMEEAALRNFENGMVEHFFNTFAPRHSQMIGEEAVRETVRTGMKKAERYEFTNRGPVQFFLEMMFLFGGHFDTDPQYDWASEILNDPEIKDQTERSEKLYEKTMIYLDKVAGAEREHVLAAFRRIDQTDFKSVIDLTQEIELQTRRLLREIYPQKYDFLGEERIKRVIESGESTAKKLGITSSLGVALCIGLSFALGHGFADDSLSPWIKATLTDKKSEDPNERAERLYRRVKINIEYTIKNLSGR